MRPALILILAIAAQSTYSQKGTASQGTIIDLVKDSGIFVIRDIQSGRIQSFKPNALEGAELRVGDTVDGQKYVLVDQAPGDSCCVVVKMDTLPDLVMVRITARKNATGENIYFNVPSTLATNMNEGSAVFTQPSHGYAMINPPTDTTRKKLFGFPLLQEGPK